MPELDNKIEYILKMAEIDLSKIHKEKGWVAWNHTQKGAEIFLALYQAVKDANLLDSNE
ncbi:MAG: hypothetical protein RR386_09665 [Bacteroidaceae bacterium]